MIQAAFPFCVRENGIIRLSVRVCSAVLFALLTTISATAQGGFTGAYITTVSGTQSGSTPCNSGTIDVEGLAVNPSTPGNVYIADALNYPYDAVCVMGSSGSVSSYQSGSTVGQLHNPGGMAFDSAGNLFIADSSSFRITRVDATTGAVTTYAGGGSTVPTLGGSGISPTSADIEALDVRFYGGNMYIAGANQIYMVTYSASTPLLTVYAGNGTSGYVDGSPSSAEFELVTGIAFDSSGNLFALDANVEVPLIGGHGVIREIYAGGTWRHNLCWER